MNIKDKYGFEYKPFSIKENIFIPVKGEIGNIIAILANGKQMVISFGKFMEQNVVNAIVAIGWNPEDWI